MNFRMLKKKYKKMYGKKPPEKLKKRIIKVMIRQSEYIKIKAIDQSVKEYCICAMIAGTKTELLTIIEVVRKEMREYERNTENLVNTTRILAERKKQLIDMTEKEVTTVLTPTGTYQILAHTKDKKKGTILGEYSTEQKAVRVLCAIQVAARHPEKVKIFKMPSDAEMIL